MPLLLDLVVINCAALLLRTAPKPAWTYPLSFVPPLTIYLLALTHVVDLKTLSPGVVGPGYALAVLALSAALLAWANRRWSVRRLFPQPSDH